MEIAIVVIVSTCLLIAVIAFFIYRKNKNDEWKGELVEKREETRTDSNDSEYTVYALYIRTESGVNRKVSVKKKLYEQFAVGDRLVKVKGETAPKKV